MRHRFWKQSGFTLIELMISVTIGLVIMLAMTGVYVNVSSVNTELSKTNNLLENGRFALDILQEDLSHAGYWGGYVPQFDDLSVTAAPADTPTGSAPDPCLAYSTANWTTAYVNGLLGIPVQTYDASPSGCSALLGNKKTSTDVLVVRHAETCLPDASNCEASSASKLYFQASFCQAEYAAATPVRYVLSNTAANFVLKKTGCTGTPPGTTGTLADKRKFISNIYYIRNYSVTSGDGIPTLMRSSFNLGGAGGTAGFETATPLIDGIDGFSVELGLDMKSRCNSAVDYAAVPAFVDPATAASTCSASATVANNTLPSNRGDGVPETPFVRCTTAVPCTAAQLANTVVVKIYVLARNSASTAGYTDAKTYSLGSTTLGPFNDGFRRHVFQTTVRLNNISGRRATP